MKVPGKKDSTPRNFVQPFDRSPLSGNFRAHSVAHRARKMKFRQIQEALSFASKRRKEAAAPLRARWPKEPREERVALSCLKERRERTARRSPLERRQV